MRKPPAYLIPFLLFFSISAILIFFAVFTAEASRAIKIDRYMLYFTEEIYHYCYIKTALFEPLAILNPSAKLLYTLIGLFFYRLFPHGIISLKLMNVFFSTGTLFFLYLLAKELKVSRLYSCIAVLMTFSFPLFFLSSISVSTEVMLAFFISAGIYGWYSKRYFWSALAFSCLPVIRQEQLLFMLVWLCVFLRRKDWKSGIVFFIPLGTWVLLNYFIAGNRLTYIYDYFVKINSRPPDISVGPVSELNFIFSLGYHPLVVLSCVGMLMGIRKNGWRLIAISALFHIAMFTGWQLNHLFRFNCLSREFRLLVPIIPLLALLAIEPLRWATEEIIKRRGAILVFLAGLTALFFCFFHYTICQLQKDPTVIEDALTGEQEKQVKEAGYWVAAYMKENKLTGVYFPGELFTHKVIRRLWMYLPGDIKFLPLISNQPLTTLSLVTYRHQRVFKDGGLMLRIDDGKNINHGDTPSRTLIKTFPGIYLYIYDFKPNG